MTLTPTTRASLLLRLRDLDRLDVAAGLTEMVMVLIR